LLSFIQKRRGWILVLAKKQALNFKVKKSRYFVLRRQGVGQYFDKPVRQPHNF